jgi:hypothetical protein
MERGQNRSACRNANDHTSSFEWPASVNQTPSSSMYTTQKIGRTENKFLPQKVPDNIQFKKIGERESPVCSRKFSTPNRLNVKIGHDYKD